MAIDLKECIDIVESGEWCSMEVFTANINKGSGGKLLIIDKARIARNQNTPELSAKASKALGKKVRDPQHSPNFTRNIELKNKSIITIHPILIHQINNHYVL